MEKDKVKAKLNESIWKLKNVIHIFDMTTNLIFVGQLASDDYKRVFHGNDWNISKGEMMIICTTKNGTLFTK